MTAFVSSELSGPEIIRARIRAVYFTVSFIALVWGLLFNVFPHETDVSARAIKEF